MHRFSADRYFLCVNASNAEKDFDWICDQNAFDAEVVYVSDQYSQLALQGPKALKILQPLVNTDLAAIKYYWLKRGKVGDLDCLITRTGYTGEDGFELYFDPDASEKVWNQLMDAGSGDGLIPTGLGARNTLRLEAKMALYGHEITDQTTPWEADLAWVVKLDKGDFLGKEALVKQKGRGYPEKARWVRDGWQRHWPRWLPGSHQRTAGRRRHQWRSVAVFEEEHRPGLRSSVAQRSGQGD